MNPSIDHVRGIKGGQIVFSEPQGESLSLLVTGDFSPVNKAEEQCLKGRYEEIFGNLLPVIRDADISVANLECPLTQKSDPIKKSGPLLKAHPRCADALVAAGFDVAALANNHIMDQGESGLKETMALCRERRIRTLGAGEDSREAGKFLLIEKKGRKIALINAAEEEFSIAGEWKAGANRLDPVRNYYQIKEALQVSDHVVVLVHGGTEHYPYPSARMMNIFRFFADAGASAVIGNHSHCPGGLMVHNGSPLVFGLGNFVFPWPGESYEPWYEGYLVTLHFSSSGLNRMDLIPYEQYKDHSGVSSLKGNDRERFLKDISALSEILADEKKYVLERDRLVRERTLSYLAPLMNMNRVKRYLYKRGWWKTGEKQEKQLLRVLNILRCDAHRDLAIDVLENILFQEKKK